MEISGGRGKAGGWMDGRKETEREREREVERGKKSRRENNKEEAVAEKRRNRFFSIQ